MYCSRSCMAEGFKERLKGENNPNYRHGPKSCEKCGKEISKNAKRWCLSCRPRGGEHNSFWGKSHSEDAKQKMSEGHYDCAGENNPFFGKSHSCDVKEKLSFLRKEKWGNLDESAKDGVRKSLANSLKSQLDSKGGTKPERIVSSFLSENNINFKSNVLMYDKFFVDFLLEDGTIIEVFGDYWHCNPSVYMSPINEHQNKQMLKDKSRISYLTACGHKVIVLWEKDILEGRIEL